MHYALPDVILQPLVDAALREDLGRRGDVTSAAVIPAQKEAKLHIVARESGVLCGIDLARLTFKTMNAHLEFHAHLEDGAALAPNTIIASIQGNTHAILSAERTALNFLTHLSGIATTTHEIQSSISHTSTRLTCTRKTIPGLRDVQKYAVRTGGGRNHRMGLDDAILIKDNHIALSGGDIVSTIQKAKAYAGHLIPVEVEVDTLEQLQLVLQEGVSLVLLDNMSPEILKKAVAMCEGKAATEASGGITPQTAKAVAETGVNFMALGYLTHSARYLDIGLDYL
ncbi:carboxylating nicotinate-nucleotide diphosphorylase [Acinetobacter nectaris]|uniref:carboxylating nicotinate-nucleotide diphosphorylase n=1 Tax=Acinetobacter nectaris TaxID=1219382 RepID=UPI001F0231F5|nr:carboxylating nicotinate-nucleotide diphosphorylase [Acinetobacter nectaris]MCF8998865.1 carboxylating nicotinate-nucleotide diphosphorylase [Acinetobacter nectaris]MCF9027894.1 carboxylating nicotinate-nucleotide diphosphorylase [Acinetobacter nectaris]